MVRAEDLSISQIAEWYFGVVDKWGHVFDHADLAQIWNWAARRANIQKLPEDPQVSMDQFLDQRTERQHFVANLRAGLLKRLYTAVSSCERCPLHVNRFKNRPVLDDGSLDNDPFVTFGEPNTPIGAVSAEIIIVAEGPGQFEQRTGTPFVSFQVLAGSMCATHCASYEGCYNPSSQMPQQPCKPRSLKKSLGDSSNLANDLFEIQVQRASDQFKIKTVAGKLDRVLHHVGLWREAWNTRQRLRTDKKEGTGPRPGSVYLCNTVKCRATVPNDEAVDGLKDRTPKKQEMDACREWLDIQLYIMQPKVIVALGNPAVTSLTGIDDPKILSIRGTVFPCSVVDGVPVIVDVHPSFIARQGEKDGDVEAEYTAGLVSTFQKAISIVSGEETPQLVVDQVSEVKQAEPPVVEDPIEVVVNSQTHVPEDLGSEVDCAKYVEPDLDVPSVSKMETISTFPSAE